MSSVLKALKKLEEQKATRKGESMKVARGLLVESQSQPPSYRLVAVVLVSVALVAVVATYAAMGGFGRRDPVGAAPPSAPGPAAEAVKPPAPLVPAVVVAPSPAAVPSPIAPRIARPVIPVPASAARNVPPPHVPVLEEPEAPGLPGTVPSQPALLTTASAPKPAASPPAAVPANLQVSGIAWQKDSTGRLAMVNGVAVGKGGKVGGAQVEEILQDRVRFSSGIRTFEVFLGAGSGDK